MKARLSAASRLSSTTRMRRAAAGVAASGSAATRSGVGASGCSGRRTTNSLPWPGPALRASTVPPCSSTSRFTSVRPMPRPPCERSSDCVDLREHVEHLLQHVRRDADAGVAHRELDARRLAAARSAVMRPPGGVYLAALLSRLQITCDEARRDRTDSGSASAGRSSVSLWPPRLDQRRRRSPARRCTSDARSTRSWRSSMRPRLMRDTSSRSSIRRTICATWRSIIARAQAAASRSCGFSRNDLERVAQRRERVAQLVREDGEELVLAPVGFAQRGGDPVALAKIVANLVLAAPRAQRGAHRADQRRHAHRALEQRDVAEGLEGVQHELRVGAFGRSPPAAESPTTRAGAAWPGAGARASRA